jgi:hypothetical protein
MKNFLLIFALFCLPITVAQSVYRDLSEFDVYQKIDSKMINGVKTPTLFYGSIKNMNGSGCYFIDPASNNIDILFEADVEEGWPGCFNVESIGVMQINNHIFYIASYLLEETRQKFTKYHALFELGDNFRYCQNTNFDEVLEKVSKQKRYVMVAIWKAQNQRYKENFYKKVIEKVGCD